MKTHTSIRTIALALVLGATSLSAQSCAAVDTFANASGHAVNASGEALQAGAGSVAGSVQAASAVVAVPVWMSGAAVGSSGAVSSAIGDSLGHVGNATMKGGDKLWDFANGDSAHRPALDHSLTGAPTKANAPAATKAPGKDPSPAEAMKRM